MTCPNHGKRLPVPIVVMKARLNRRESLGLAQLMEKPVCELCMLRLMLKAEGRD